MKLSSGQNQNENKEFPEFHPQTVIRDWGNGYAFHLSDALTGVIVFGATGSGKTSGPAKHLAYGYLAAGFGGVVMATKKEECRQWQEWAAATGRTDDLIIINAKGDWRFNFLEWEASRPEEGGGMSINLVNILCELALAIAGQAEGAAGDNKFWEDGLRHMLTNLVDLILLAGLQVTLPLLRSILISAAYSPEQVVDADWQKTSTCAATISEADSATKQADSQIRADYEETRDYWLVEFPNLTEKTRSIITLMVSILVRPLVTRPLRQLFSSDTNIRPEDTFNGKIICVNLAVQEFGLVGRIANLAWKYCFQVAVLRRMQPADRQSFLRPVFLWADEAQNFVSKFDSEYQAVARSAGGCTVYLTQNIESLRRVLKNNYAVDSLLGNLQTLFFCANTGPTNEWAAKLLGERWVKVTSTNVGQSRNDGGLPTIQPHGINGGFNSGLSRSEQRRYFVEPASFTILRRGGPQYNFLVDAIVYNGGHQYQTGGELLPYIKLTFNQK